MARHLKLIAAVAVVLVAISGFSPARRGVHHSSRGGGGCSSHSSSSHNSTGHDSGYSYRRSHHRYHHSSSYGRGSSRGSSPTAVVTRCAAKDQDAPRAVVEVTNHQGVRKTVTVAVRFLAASGRLADSGTAQVSVGADSTATTQVRMGHPERIGDVARCEVGSVS